MADLVIRDDLFLMVGQHRGLALLTGDDNLDAFLKVFLGRSLATKTNSTQGSLVDDVRKIGTGGTGRRAGDGSEVDARLGLHIFGVELENRLAPGEVGQLDRNAAVEAARAQKRGARESGRFVAARTTIPFWLSKPSISVRS